MKFLKGFIKIIEGILLLLIPLILFYWFLANINLQAFKPIVAVFEYFFNPFISFIKLFVRFEIPYENSFVDFAPLIFALVILVIYLVFYGFEIILNFLEKSVNQTKIKLEEEHLKKESELTRIKFLEELAKNKVVYLVLKFRKKENSSAYLYNEENPSVENQFSSIFSNILDASEKFNAKKHENFEGEANTYNFIFYSVTDAIDYSFFVYNKVQKENREFSKSGMKLSATIACHCAYSELSADNDFSVTSKILNLGGENEITVSELFKNKYVALKEETNLIFNSKGIYNIDNFQIEAYQLKTINNSK